jgi:hypothetical protein
MRLDLNRVPPLLQIILAFLAGLGLGLAYSWLIAPVKYVDANPSILRADFKDQYRVVIAAAYGSSHDLERARVRLSLLGDADPKQALSAQAQQMLAAGEPFENARLLAQLASDLQAGIVSLPSTPTLTAISIDTPTATNQPVGVSETVSVEETLIPTGVIETPLVFASPTPRPTHTPIPPPGKPFALVGQDTVCDTALTEGLLQVMLMDSRRRQVPGIEIIVTWNGGEDRFFTGFKPEVGNGYADFQMEEGIIYSVRVIESGRSVPDISIPTCTDANGQQFLGGILLTFQQP